jgi:hypothetical protein
VYNCIDCIVTILLYSSAMGTKERFVVVRIKDSTRRRIKARSALKGLSIWMAIDKAFPADK